MMPETDTVRYFTYTDEKSHKFWQIQVAGTSYTVSYGRIGTKGQQQQKIFDDAAQCRKEAVRIIGEKVSKGYTEEVGGLPVTTPEALNKKPSAERAALDKEAEAAMLKGYQQIIDKKQVAALTPFLRTVDPVHYPALRKAIKAAWTYYCDYVETSKTILGNSTQTSWDRRGTDEQRCIVELSCMALLSPKELKAYNVMLYLNDTAHEQVVDELLEWARPGWLTDFLNDEGRSNSWTMIEYRRLRCLEAKGYVHYLPELFVRSMAQCRSHGHHSDYKQFALQYIDYLCSDALVRKRELPLLFEYETDMHAASYWLQPLKDGPTTQFSIWAAVFSRLLGEGKLDRLWFLEACLGVQSKDWNGNLRLFFRKQVDEMQPRPEEWLQLQHSIYPLLGTLHPQIVNWASGIIRELSDSEALDLQQLLEWAPAVMMRSDCKTALKHLLRVFEKALKAKKADRVSILLVLADVFTINDLALQTKAAALIRKYGAPEEGELCDKLQLYREQMLGALRDEFSDYLAADVKDEHEAEAVAGMPYVYSPAKAVLLSELEEVTLPQNWNDWLFAIGRYIGSDEVLDMEVAMNACIQVPEDAPKDSEQLLPYLKQLANGSQEGWIKHLTHTWLLHVLQDWKTAFDLKQWKPQMTMLRLQTNRLAQVQRKMQTDSTLSLLSLPTHKPHYVSSLILVQRLLQYQESGEKIDVLDLCIALARMLPNEGSEALQLCAQLQEPVASLMRYALSGEGAPAPRKQGGLLRNIVKGLGLDKDKDKDAAYLEMAYAVVARTRQPDGVFEHLEQSEFAERANVVRPFFPSWRISENRNNFVDWRTKLPAFYAWRELSVDLPQKSYSASPLLYSNDLSEKQQEHLWWYGMTSAYDTRWWYSLVPQYPEGLCTVLLQCGCRRSDINGAAAAGLRIMLEPQFQFREMSLLLLSCGLMAEQRENRGMAAEVLIQHFGTQTIAPAALGQHMGALLRESYAPVQRVADSLQLVKDVSALHNTALGLLLEALLLSFELLPELPKNTRKLLEIYLDVLVKTKGQVKPELLSLLDKHAGGTLKPVVKSLRNITAASTISV